MPFISERDYNDIVFGCEHDFDMIAASFTRTAQDILDVRKICIEHGRPDMQIIAKIENPEGVDNIDEIIAVSDGIMVARGDLGVEIPAEEVPVILHPVRRRRCCGFRRKSEEYLFLLYGRM